MKILIINTKYFPLPSKNGGAIQYLLNEFLKKNEKNSITVYSALADKTKTNEDCTEYRNTEFRYIKSNRIYGKIRKVFNGIIRKLINKNFGDEYVRDVISDLKRKNELNDYDKIIVLNNVNNVLYLRKNIKSNIILYLHNDYLNKKTKHASKIIDSLDQIWCVSYFIKSQVDDIKENSKTVVLYNGINEKSYCEKSYVEIDIREKAGLTQNDYVVLYVGRIMPQKGVEELINAVIETHSRIENIKLLIIGDSPKRYSNYLKNLKKKYAQHDYIKFLGNINHDDIIVYQKNSDVQVIPSKCNEAFGLTVVEAMYAQIPVIASNSGGITEIIDNDSGYIVDKNNLTSELVIALNKVYSQSIEEKTKMITNALEKVGRFSLEQYINNVNNMIKQDVHSNQYFIFVTGSRNLSGADFSMYSIIEKLKSYNIIPIVLLAHNGKTFDFFKAKNVETMVIPFKSWICSYDNKIMRKVSYLIKVLYNKMLIVRHCKEIETKYPRVVCVYNNGFSNSFSLYLSKKLNSKYVMHIREFGDLDFNWKFELGKKSSLQMIYKRSDLIIAISNAVKESFFNAKGYDNIEVVYNGIKAKEYRIPKPSEIVKIVISGRLGKEKNHIELLKAINMLVLNGYTKFKLDIYGTGNEEERIKKFIIQNNLEEYVELKGFVLDIKYENYDIGVMTSFSEGFGRVTAEYMMNSLAVIASNTGANAELIEDNYSGLIYKLGDCNDLYSKLLYYIEKPKEIERMGTNAYYKALNSFSEDVYVKNIFKLLINKKIIKNEEKNNEKF